MSAPRATRDRVRHYTDRSGLERIRASGLIWASDPDRGVADGRSKYPGRQRWERVFGPRYGGRIYRAWYRAFDGASRGVWVVPTGGGPGIRRWSTGLLGHRSFVEFDLLPGESARVVRAPLKRLFRQRLVVGRDIVLAGRRPTFVR